MAANPMPYRCGPRRPDAVQEQLPNHRLNSHHGVQPAAICALALGGGSGALIGLDMPDAVSRAFEEEIRDGHILVVLDGEPEILARAELAVESTGAMALSFHALTSMS